KSLAGSQGGWRNIAWLFSKMPAGKKNSRSAKLQLTNSFCAGCRSLVAGLSLFPSPQLSNSISRPAIAIDPIGGGLVFFPHGLINLLPQHPAFPWRRNAQSDLVAAPPAHVHSTISSV